MPDVYEIADQINGRMRTFSEAYEYEPKPVEVLAAYVADTREVVEAAKRFAQAIKDHQPRCKAEEDVKIAVRALEAKRG